MRRACSSSTARRAASRGSTSKVPRGAWSELMAALPRLVLMREFAQERIGVALDAQGGEAHVAGVDGRLGRIGLHQRVDRLQQRGPVSTGKVDAADGGLGEDGAGEEG